MAGFFGLFDYSKPGPGVSKNAPKKKPFIVFFEIFTRKFWKLIVANLLFVLFSLPVVTMGLAFTGLSYITRNFAREKHAFIGSDFVDTIKKNWKQGLAAGLINLIVQLILIFDIYFFFQNDNGIFGSIMLAVILSIALIFTFMKYYIYFLIVTFKLKLKQVYKNSLIFAFAGLGRNFLLFLIFGLCYALGFLLLYQFNYIGLTICLFAYIFIFPAFRMLLIQFTVFPIIKKLMIDPYYKEHPDEDKEALYALNILDEDYYDSEDRVFEDTLPADEEEEETPKTNIPRQYTQEEMERLRRKHSARYDDDDDDTI
ncbi:MAG TPA: DUF624 domain-containing protein [Clostridiales bacterium]|nr:DUF624 domain-containing protein [Clostridiales bacterium]